MITHKPSRALERALKALRREQARTGEADPRARVPLLTVDDVREELRFPRHLALAVIREMGGAGAAGVTREQLRAWIKAHTKRAGEA